MSERYETTVHDKRTGMPVRGCDGDEIATAERLRETLKAANTQRFDLAAEIERLQEALRFAYTQIKAGLDPTVDGHLALFQSAEAALHVALGDTEHE